MGYMVRTPTTTRSRMRLMGVRGKTSEGYNAYLSGGGVRFTGRPLSSDDMERRRLAQHAPEPDWDSMSSSDLFLAERMALHRLSGGETSWRGPPHPHQDRVGS